ncbi:MAG: glycosyltransferase, partial [Planctomycetaceae bacterium]|nr:glycosyltransferase [Planctomycetaceae bacterium]
MVPGPPPGRPADEPGPAPTVLPWTDAIIGLSGLITPSLDGPAPTVLPWTDARAAVAAPGGGRAIKVLMIAEACGGGAGRHVLDLAEGLLERGCDVHLIHSPGRVDAFFHERLGRLRAIRQVSYPMHRGVHPGDFSAAWWVRR